MEMLQALGYHDMGMVDLLTMGINVVGQRECAGAWQADPMQAPKMTMKSLWAGATDAERKVLVANMGSEWTLDDQELWEESQQEVALRNNLQGPFTKDELEAQLGKLWNAAPRFPERQGEKLRPIDHFPEFDVNAAFGASEKVRMKNLD